jgi:hypothetical protein
MKRRLVGAGVFGLALCLLVSSAYPWGSAVHAYVADHLGKKLAPQNLNEMYGIMAPDIFNYSFDLGPVGYPAVYAATHYNFMKIWRAAILPLGKAQAFGFVAHNDAWGADFTAHHSGQTVGLTEGYVVAKAQILLGQLKADDGYNLLGLPDKIGLEVAHNIIETSLDILLKRADPSIGTRVGGAALLASPEFSLLFIKAFTSDLAAYFGGRFGFVKAVMTADLEFRKMMIAYGQALMQNEATAVDLLAGQMAELSRGFLASYGIPLPSGVNLKPLIVMAINGGMTICAGDFLGEIQATTAFVKRNLAANGIIY